MSNCNVFVYLFILENGGFSRLSSLLLLLFPSSKSPSFFVVHVHVVNACVCNGSEVRLKEEDMRHRVYVYACDTTHLITS